MKTKFTAVVKIRKKKVDDIENELFKMDAMINKTKETLAEDKEKYNSMESPMEGSFSNLIAFEELKKAFRYEIESLKMALTDMINQRNALLGALKEANAEYEKMKYLDGEEVGKVLKARALQESKDLDEIGVMLFNNRSMR